MKKYELFLNGANALVRKTLVSRKFPFLNYVVVTEYPKSGGTWLGLMLAELLGVPFPRNSFPLLQKSIMHGHYLPTLACRKPIVLWRDGRDVMVSWYYHCLFCNEHKNHILVNKVSNELALVDKDDIRTNLPQFIEYCFTRQSHPKFSWSEFVNSWIRDESAIFIRYEDLRNDTLSELIRIMTLLDFDLPELSALESVIEKFSFSTMSNRTPGMENKGSFLRKGIVGDWENQFSKEAREVFCEYAGEQLVLLGYEKNSNWASSEIVEQ